MKRSTFILIKIATFVGLIAACIGFLLLMGCGHRPYVKGNCVPRAMFAAMAWTIETGKPVGIADTGGHWQAQGWHDGYQVYLDEDGRGVWPSRPHNDRVPKILNLREAMEHFLTANPWAIPVKVE